MRTRCVAAVQVGTVYRARHGRPPREAAEAAFDIVCTHRSGNSCSNDQRVKVQESIFRKLIYGSWDACQVCALSCS
jgi:hypothetical protein